MFYDEDFGEIVSHRISGSFHWTLHLQSFKIGDQEIDIIKNSVLTDTGSSVILLPAKTFEQLVETICEHIEDLTSAEIDDSRVFKIGYPFNSYLACSYFTLDATGQYIMINAVKSYRAIGVAGTVIQVLNCYEESMDKLFPPLEI
jgi:hypothetical protein